MKPPREENFLDMLKYYCCPSIKIQLFITIISIIDIIMFIISLSISTEKIKGEFLEPNRDALFKLGSMNGYNLKKGYIWLLITPIFLHANLMHLFSNLVTQLIFGISLETSVMGTFKTIILYFISGIGGNLFSYLIADDKTGVGASGAIFGIVGAFAGFLVINWSALKPFGFFRCQLLLMIIFMVFFNIVFAETFTKNVDIFSHLGGIFVGFFLSIILIKPMLEESSNRTFKIASAFTLLFYFLIGFLIFFLANNPSKIN